MENREEADRLCCICEKRSAGRIVVGIPQCLRCRTESVGRVMAAAAKPTVISFPLSGEEALIHDSTLRAYGLA
jgi:ribosomal protein L37AE/L43A